MSLISAVTTLAALPTTVAAHFPATVALIGGGRRITYQQFDIQTNRIANALMRQGVRPHDRVAMLVTDPVDATHLVFGIAKARAVSVNINPRLAVPEIAHILSDSGARLLVVDEELRSLMAKVAAVSDLPEVAVATHSTLDPPLNGWCGAASASPPPHEYDAEDVVVQIYTSGTTGRPKGVQLPNRSFFAIAQRLEATGDCWIGWTDQSVSLLFVPLFHIGGLWWLVRGLALGSTTVVLRAFEPAAILRAIPEYRVTKTCMVPAMAQVLLREPGCRGTDFSSLETIVYGGSSIGADVLRQAMEVFGCDFCQIYGMTETGNMAVCFRPEDHRRADDRRLRAAGTPLPGVELRIVDGDGREVQVGTPGEIVVRSPAAMKGYWDSTSDHALGIRDGWIATGDIGYRDEEGFVYICDRLKDMIISAGENIYPAEIERALRRHPEVADVAVIGIPDRLRGEAPKAIVVRAAGASVGAAELVRHTRGYVAGFKVPTSIEFVDEIPRNASGKVLKTVLRERFGPRAHARAFFTLRPRST
jgi:acyl-CoA synthetase (AMP-forming)/AMP-acid ligase II